MDIIKDLIEQGRLEPKPQKVLKGFEENQTISPEYEIIHFPQQCPDCNLTVTNRKTLFYKRLSPVIHWANKCKNCDCFKDPRTGKYNLTSAELAVVYRFPNSKPKK